MAIKYKTEGTVELPGATPLDDTVILQWETDSGSVRIFSGKASLRLSQKQISAFQDVAPKIWDDIGPEKFPRAG